MRPAPRRGTNIRTAMAVTIPRADIFGLAGVGETEVDVVGTTFVVYERPCGALLGQGGVPAGK